MRKFFFNAILTASPYCDQKLNFTHNDNNFGNICTFDKVHLECDRFEGTIANYIRQHILFNFYFHTQTGFTLL